MTTYKPKRSLGLNCKIELDSRLAYLQIDYSTRVYDGVP